MIVMAKWVCATPEEVEIIKEQGLNPAHCVVSHPGEDLLVILDLRDHRIDKRETYVRLPENDKIPSDWERLPPTVAAKEDIMGICINGQLIALTEEQIQQILDTYGIRRKQLAGYAAGILSISVNLRWSCLNNAMEKRH